jgi:hypothetical protein
VVDGATALPVRWNGRAYANPKPGNQLRKNCGDGAQPATDSFGTCLTIW